MNALSQAADLRSQAHTLAEQALFGDLFADVSTETIAQLHAQADALEAQAVVAPAPAPAPRGAGWRAKFSPNAEYYERSKTNILRAIQGTIKGAEAHSRKEALIAHESQYNSHVQKLAALKAKALRDGVVISYTVPVYPDSLKWVEPAPAPVSELSKRTYVVEDGGQVIGVRESSKREYAVAVIRRSELTPIAEVLSYHIDEARALAYRGGAAEFARCSLIITPVRELFTKAERNAAKRESKAAKAKSYTDRVNALSAKEKVDAIFEELLSPVSEPVAEIPSHDDDDLMAQWRAENRAGNGQSFGDPDDLTCDADVYEAAEIETARVICELNTPNCYLVSWSDDHYVVCDANGWWACRVAL